MSSIDVQPHLLLERILSIEIVRVTERAAVASDGKAVAEKMRELPVDDFFAKGRVREDGRMVHDMYLVAVKSPNDSKATWDYYKVLRRIPAEEAAQPLSESKCSLVKK
jgi:branched-chain amino acid transport system substrate-binding protein